MDPAVANLNQKIVKLEGKIATLVAENKRLASELEHVRRQHVLELENLQLKAAAIVTALEKELDSRTPILSALFNAATQLSGDLATSLDLLPPPDPEKDK